MWSESSSVCTVNLAKKIYYNLRDIEFFLGFTFLAHPTEGAHECSDFKNFRGSHDPGHAPILLQTVPENTHAKFEVSSCNHFGALITPKNFGSHMTMPLS